MLAYLDGAVSMAREQIAPRSVAHATRTLTLVHTERRDETAIY